MLDKLKGYDKADEKARADFLRKIGQPNENHKRLAEVFVGEWDYVTKTYSEPGARASESRGTSKVVPVYNGLFMAWSSEGTTASGQRYEAMGNWGYDTPQMLMSFTQYSNQSAAAVIARGTWETGSNEINLKSSHHVDPLTGARDGGGARMVVAIESPIKHSIRLYEWAPDGSKEFVASESIYTSKKR